ncbi:MAG TPA: hypothetical protein VLE70_12405 [Anaerolineae bacterium]|jgi:hypothetical protein|nr:hypothetical protein [Anaerolineae bacterium]
MSQETTVNDVPAQDPITRAGVRAAPVGAMVQMVLHFVADLQNRHYDASELLGPNCIWPAAS